MRLNLKRLWHLICYSYKKSALNTVVRRKAKGVHSVKLCVIWRKCGRHWLRTRNYLTSKRVTLTSSAMNLKNKCWASKSKKSVKRDSHLKSSWPKMGCLKSLYPLISHLHPMFAKSSGAKNRLQVSAISWKRSASSGRSWNPTRKMTTSRKPESTGPSISNWCVNGKQSTDRNRADLSNSENWKKRGNKASLASWLTD